MKFVLASLTAVIAAFLAFVALKNPHFSISREITVQAPPEKIFPYLNNSKLANQWMPWQELYPKTKMSFSGPEAGVGSRSEWTGDEHLGTGSATITASKPNERVAIELVYVSPMAMRQSAEYLVSAAPNGSVVTWRVEGENTFIGRLMCTFMNMDKMVGDSFELGLSKLKSIVEKG